MSIQTDTQPSAPIQLGFATETLRLPVASIIPLKKLPSGLLASEKFKQILTSIREIGIIEPPMVTPDKTNPNIYMLLDGHLRLEAVKQLGQTEITCLISNDDEAFTYNKHISRLSPVQEHKMIVKATQQGVPIERLAQVLGIDPSIILRRKNLLDGVCKEAQELLKDKMVAIETFSILRRMKPMRQIEVATLMNDSATYYASYANAMLAATPQDQLAELGRSRKLKGFDDDKIARMQSELANVQRQYSLIEDSYGADILNLTIARGYISNLIGNAKVVRYLAQHHPEYLKQFQNISEMSSLNGKAAVG